MAARRSLGGGRVLGSGKNLAPPVPIKPQLRPTGALSPSNSSISLSSQTSSTPLSTENEDITARVALDEHGAAQAAAAASTRMVCPICNDEMVCI
jgi:rabenosyn-5